MPTSKTRTKRAVVGPRHRTRHHMVPVSKTTQDDRIRLGKINIKIVDWRYHDAWHAVFGNLTPYEAVLLVIKELAPEGHFTQAKISVSWDRFKHSFQLDPTQHRSEETKYKPCKKYPEYIKLLFGARGWVDVVAHIVYNWSPDGYFKHIAIESQGDNGVSTFSCSRANNDPAATP